MAKIKYALGAIADTAFSFNGSQPMELLRVHNLLSFPVKSLPLARVPEKPNMDEREVRRGA